MSKRRMWAALPGVALMAMALAAAGCGTVKAGSANAGAAGTGSAGTGAAGAASGSSAASTGNPSPVPTISSGIRVAGEPACANWPTGAKKGQLTASFVPVTVLRCASTTTAVPGKGLYYSATLERATSDISVLVAALRRPSTREPAGTMCPMLAMIPPQIVLIAKDGSMLSPTFPVTGCGLLQSPVLAALNQMPWQAVSVRLLSKIPGSTVSGTAPATGMNGTPAIAANQ